MRDYSEVQNGKCDCDRLSGSGKLRLRGFMNAGNDVMNAVDIKKGKLRNITNVLKKHLSYFNRN
jgi:hypothetical protein